MPRELSSTIYESTASAYNIGRKPDPVITHTLGQSLIFNPQGRYLEIGCGTGNYTQALSMKGFKIQGVDRSSSMLQEARSRFPELTWHEGDMRDLPFDSHSFDGAVSINTLHYVRHSMAKALGEMKRILKKGGRLALFLVTLEQCLQFWAGHYFPFFWELGENVLLPQDDLLNLLTQAGFTNIRIDPYFVTESSEDLFG